MNNISLRQLSYLVAVSEEGSISEAAKEVGRSQSAVTAAIKELETEIGLLLFDRTATGMTLTVAGRELLARSYRILRDVDDSVRVVRSLRRDVTGSVTIGAMDFIAAYYLPARIARFRQAFPSVDVNLIEMTQDRIGEALETGTLDCALLAVRGDPALTRTAYPHCSVEALDRHHLRLWVGEGNPLLSCATISPAEIAAEPFIMWTSDMYEPSVTDHFLAAGHALSIAIRASSVEAIRSLVANGHGVTLMPDIVYRQRSLEGFRIERLDVGRLFPGETEIQLLARSDQDFHGPVRALRAFLHKSVA